MGICGNDLDEWICDRMLDHIFNHGSLVRLRPRGNISRSQGGR